MIACMFLLGTCHSLLYFIFYVKIVYLVFVQINTIHSNVLYVIAQCIAANWLSLYCIVTLLQVRSSVTPGYHLITRSATHRSPICCSSASIATCVSRDLWPIACAGLHVERLWWSFWLGPSRPCSGLRGLSRGLSSRSEKKEFYSKLLGYIFLCRAHNNYTIKHYDIARDMICSSTNINPF